jgi:hypothetical protein
MDDYLSTANMSGSDAKSIPKKLVELYSRRAAVDDLIRCLESYAACQSKDGNSVHRRRA